MIIFFYYENLNNYLLPHVHHIGENFYPSLMDKFLLGVYIPIICHMQLYILVVKINHK
jgi:hypothetical protein